MNDTGSNTIDKHTAKVRTSHFRFYEELNDFLTQRKEEKDIFILVYRYPFN